MRLFKIAQGLAYKKPKVSSVEHIIGMSEVGRRVGEFARGKAA